MRKLMKFLGFVAALIITTIFGAMIASYVGVASIYVIVPLLVASLFVPKMSNVSLMALTITSAYSGEFLEKLLVKATTGNELVSGGHIRIQDGIKSKYSIPRLRTGRMLQKRKEQPTESDAKGDFTIDEKHLIPQDVMAFTTFNPRSFESIWRPFQPEGNLVFAQLPANVQEQLVSEMVKTVDFELGNEFINGVLGTSEGEYFDGILTRIKADSETVSITGAVTITEENVIDVFKQVKSSVPRAVRRNKNLKLFMSDTTADMYDYVVTEKPYKGKDYTQMNPERFKGLQIVPLADWPDDVVVAAVASVDLDSNFWAGVGYADDAEVILIDKLNAAGEKYFFKLLLKADTNIVWGDEIVLYDGSASAGGEESPVAAKANVVSAPTSGSAPAQDNAPVDDKVVTEEQEKDATSADDKVITEEQEKDATSADNKVVKEDPVDGKVATEEQNASAAATKKAKAKK